MQRSAICTSGRALLGGRVSLATACTRPVGIVGRRGVWEGALYSRPQPQQQSLGRRRFATDSNGGQKEPPSGTKGGLQAAKPSGQGTAVTVAQKVVEGGKDAGYGLVILGGVVLLGAAAYQLFSAGFAPSSPQHVYSKASDLLRRDPEVQKLLGPNIKTYGEETSRRRRGLQSTKYFNAATQRDHVRVLFSAEGDVNAADVIADVTASGQFYLLTVEVPVTGEKLVYTNTGKFERR